MRCPSSVALTTAAALALIGASFGCINREVSEVPEHQQKEQVSDVPVKVNRDIDILFVIDNSGSMKEEQTSLQQNFNRFINVLNNIEGGLPNVHIGVVSTDVGAGPFGISNCTSPGDNGALQNAPRNGTCPAPGPEPFIIDSLNPVDGSRSRNYSGTGGSDPSLSETFSCIAALGTTGCGFEQPLESARRALDGTTNPQNGKFLRKDAFLAVIFITDEDDCSTKNTQMFDNSAEAVAKLGPLNSYRCFEYGVKCDPDTPRQTGAKTLCASREDSPYLYTVKEYVDFFKGLKEDEKNVIVAGIIGNPSPVVVGLNGDGNLTLDASCSSASGDADPAVRLKAFLDAVPDRNTVSTICDNDLSDALTVIAELLKQVLGSPCLIGPVRTDPLECEVSDVRFQNTDRQTESTLPQCNNTDGDKATNQPCWLIVKDEASCPATNGDGSPTNNPTSLLLQIFPKERTVASGTHTIVRCVSR